MAHKGSLQITIPETELIRGSDGKPHAVFYIQLLETDCDGDECDPIVVSRRFSDFRHFDRDWTALHPMFADRFVLPKTVRIGNRSPKVVESRRAHLEEYLSGLAQLPCMSTKLAEFLHLKTSLFERHIREKRRQSIAEEEARRSERSVSRGSFSRETAQGFLPIHDFEQVRPE